MKTSSEQTSSGALPKGGGPHYCYYQAYSTKLSSDNFYKLASRMLSETVTHVTNPGYIASRVNRCFWKENLWIWSVKCVGWISKFNSTTSFL